MIGIMNMINLVETQKSKFSSDWWDKLSVEFEQQYMQDIYNYLISRKIDFADIYPSSDKVYKAFEEPFKNVKIVILGQDPYHTTGAAQGLAFSVSSTYPSVPPSLVNILAEVENDIYDGFYLDKNPNLEHWSKQGVFLLNTCLTVEKGLPLSHEHIGWQKFTQVAFQHICDKNEPVVFMLWGNHAKAYKQFIHNKYHLVLEAMHPSPFSVKGFKGCKHFSKANQYLLDNNLKPIIW